MLALLLAAAAAAAVPGTALQAQAPAGGRVKVLFLGDDGLHEPNPRAKSVLPVLASRGIDLYYSDDPAELDPERLRHYHTVIFYNNHRTISPAQLRALTGFVENGGGFVPIHSASAAFQNAPEYIALVGGSFRSHGTGTFSTVHVQPDHPVLRGLVPFESWDETYVHANHNPQGRTVLAVRREGGVEEPWTWVREQGRGRVFYTAWGHDERTWENPGFHDLLERGIRWAAGDWALNERLADPQFTTFQLSEPLPNYLPGRQMGEPITTAPVALDAEESLGLMTLLPGFRAEHFAGEPMVYKPIDFSWDEAGRLWVVETIDYPDVILDEGVPGNDRIVILEDVNGDGRADRRTLFAEGLNLATTLMHTRGGVMVGQAPHILFLKDTTGDGRADLREVVSTGWPRNDTHGALSNFRYGFDNQIWGSVGYNGYRGTVAGVTYDRATFAQGFFRFPADGSTLDYVARTSNNTWGIGFTEDGYVFGSTANNRPSQFVHIPGRYYRALGLESPPVLPGIADRNDYYPVASVMQVDQFGRYTAAAGHEIYTARAFPREFWNRMAFVTDPTGHLVGMFELVPDGSGFSAINRWSFAASRDLWAAPVQAKVGPDGAVWVADFYSIVTQHNPTPSGWQTLPGAAYGTPYRSRDRGRIYRIVHEDMPAAAPMRLDNATPAQLVAALRNDNLFWRMTAQRLIVERGESDVVGALIQLLDDRSVDELGLNAGAFHALWTLDGLGAFGTDATAREALYRALRHPAASVRRAALTVAPRDTRLQEHLLAADGPGSDGDPQVRLTALLALSELPASPAASAWVAARALDPTHARDPWLPDAAAIAGFAQGPAFLLDLVRRQPAADDAEYLAGLGAAITLMTRAYAMQGPPQTATIVSLIEATPHVAPRIRTAILTGVVTGTLGWPAGQPPTLTNQQRASLAAAARGVSEETAREFNAIAERWEMPDLFR